MHNELNNLSQSNLELALRGLAAYFGMSVKEFNKLINGDAAKLKRFYYDFINNHN